MAQKRTPATTITKDAQLEEVIEVLRKAPAFSFDTETESEDPSSPLLGMSFYTPKMGRQWIPVGFNHDELLEQEYSDTSERRRIIEQIQPKQLSKGLVLDRVEEIFRDRDKIMYAHNLKHDAEVLFHNGIRSRNIWRCTMMLAWFVDENELIGLKPRVLKEFNYKMAEYKDIIGKGKQKERMADLSMPFVSSYAGDDAEWCWRLKELYWPKLERLGLTDVYCNVFMRVIRVLYSMETKGVPVNVEELRNLGVELEVALAEAQAKIYTTAGREFNINSGVQVAGLLFGPDSLYKLKMRRKTTGGKPSTDEDTLRGLVQDAPICEDILKYRKFTKLHKTYVIGIGNKLKNGKIYAKFNPGGTVTGRLSSSNPNMQNIPNPGKDPIWGARLRNIFMAPKGWKLVVADAKNIELRILAHFSGDPVMIDAFLHGKDLHNITAEMIFGKGFTKAQRGEAKAVNFGISYGEGPFTLAQNLKIDIKEAERYIKAYFDKYLVVGEWIEATHAYARQHGYVKTLLGRYRRLPEATVPRPSFDLVRSGEISREENSRIWREVGRAERQSVNSIIQGSSADLIFLSMIKMHPRLPKPAHIILQVHDELVVLTPDHMAEEVAEIVKDCMEHPFNDTKTKLRIPVEADVHIVQRWGEAK